MISMFRKLAWLSAFILTIGPATSRLHAADGDTDPVKTFDDVFGDQYRKVTSTPSVTDDAELAVDLAKAVKTIEMPASLLRVIVDRMSTLSDKASGALMPTVETIDKLKSVEKDDARKTALEEKAITLLEKASESGDAASKAQAAVLFIERVMPLADRLMEDRKVEAAHAWYGKALNIARQTGSSQAGAIALKYQKADEGLKDIKEIDALEKKIEADPKDLASRNKLIEIHLVRRDDPSAAVWFAGEGVDAKTRKLVPIAARDGVNSDPATLAELAGWYNDLAEAAAPAYKVAMYKRAKGYYEKFLAVHKTNDLLMAKAKLTLGQIDGKLKDLQSSSTASTPVTPGTTPTPGTTSGADSGPGALTVEIQGPTITDPARVDRLFSQHARMVGKAYVAIGSDYTPVLDYDAKFPSSAKESLAAVKARMTTTKVEFNGLVRRNVTVPPVPAEAEAVAMALPTLSPGAWGYLHSVEVAEIRGEDEMIVKNFWLVDRTTLDNVPYDERKEREALSRRQNDWNFADNTMRIFGFPTAGLKPGERVGIGGKSAKPLQVYIVTTDEQNNVFKKTRPVVVLTAKLTVGLDEKQFADLLTKRNLTRTDLVNIYLESQRSSLKDAVALTIRRIEAKGAKLP